jgi:hypothetical protein
MCKVKYALGVGSNEKCETEHYPHPISYAGCLVHPISLLPIFMHYYFYINLFFPGSVVHYIIVPSVGIFSFLALGLSKHIFHFWKVLFRLLLERKFAEISELLSNEKALSKLSGSSYEERRTRASTMVNSASLRTMLQQADASNPDNNKTEKTDNNKTDNTTENNLTSENTTADVELSTASPASN